MAEKFNDYTHSSSFEATTGNNPLTTQQSLMAMIGYNFTIKYGSGKKNADAEGLSHYQDGKTVECTIFSDVIKAISMSVTATECTSIDISYVSVARDSTQPFAEDISEQLLQAHGLTSKE